MHLAYRQSIIVGSSSSFRWMLWLKKFYEAVSEPSAYSAEFHTVSTKTE